METNPTQQAEQRGAEAERTRILVLIDDEIEDWSKGEITFENGMFYKDHIQSAVDALRIVRNRIVEGIK